MKFFSWRKLTLLVVILGNGLTPCTSNVQASELWSELPPSPQVAYNEDADAKPETLHEMLDVQAIEYEMEQLRQRLAAMEAEWGNYQSDLADEKKSKASKPTFKINGRIHADYWAYPNATEGIGFFEHPSATDPQFGTDPEDFLAFRRIRLEMKGDILDWGFWRVQVDFNNPSTPEMKDVYIGMNLPCNHSFVVGNQKRPMGLDHLNSSRYNVFLERPLAVESFNEDARRPGMTMYGHNDDQSLGWAYGAYLMENVSTDGRYRGDAYQASLNWRLHGSPIYECDGRRYWHWAVSGMVAHPNGDADGTSDHNNEGRFRTRAQTRSESRWLNTGRINGADYYEILGVESMYNNGPFQLTGEYFTTWMQRQSNVNSPDLFFHGGYLFAAYNLTGEHIPYSRKSGTIGRLKPNQNFFLADRCKCECGNGWGAWQVAARCDFIDLTDGDISGGKDVAGTLALNWFFTPYSKLQFNAIYGHITERGPIGGFDSGHYTILGTRYAIEF